MNWSECEARCWFTYADAVEGRKYACKITGDIIPVDAGMAKLPISAWDVSDIKELFADRVEVNINGSWRTVLNVWQEENVPIDHTPERKVSTLIGSARPCATDGCDGMIHLTGKRGRPATKCDACRGVA